MLQIKEWIKTPEKELNKIEIINLPDAELKTLFIRMLKELSENLSIKKIQSEIKATLIEIKNNLQGINSRVNEAENQISMIWNIKEQKTKQKKNNQSEQQEEKRIPKNEDSISSLWDNFKCTNICIMGCWKEKRESKTLETYMEK